MKRRNLLITGLPLLTLITSLTNWNSSEKLITREVKEEKTKVNRDEEFDYYNIDDSVENKISVVAIKSFDSSIFENIDEVNINEDNKVEIRYEVEGNIKEETVILNAYLNLNNENLFDTLIGKIIIRENNIIDVLFDTDDGSFYISELIDKTSYEECGWFTKLLKIVVVTISVAQIIISPLTAVVAVVTIAILDKEEKSQSEKNYEHNKTLSNITDYIYSQNQNKFKDWKVGLNSNINNSGCGYIAAYNTMKYIGKNQYFYDVIKEFDSNDGTNAYGFLGADPSHFATYFKKHSVEYVYYNNYENLDNALLNICNSSKISTRKSKPFMLPDPDPKEKIDYPTITDTFKHMVILCYWNTNNIFDGAHYIAFNNVTYDTKTKTFSADTYNLRNNPSDKKREEFITTKFIDSDTQGNCIVAYIVSK